MNINTEMLNCPAHELSHYCCLISFGNEHDVDTIFVCHRNVVKSFYTAGMLFDVLSVFDEVSEDVSRFYWFSWPSAYLYIV